LRDGVIDVDVATQRSAVFSASSFELPATTSTRMGLSSPTQIGLPDAVQYTPVLNTGLNWQIYSGPGFHRRSRYSEDAWFHLQLEIAGAQAKLYVPDMNKPALVMTIEERYSERATRAGRLTGATYFRNFEVRETPAIPWSAIFPRCPQVR